MRVNELSKQIGKSNKEVLEILQKNHFDVKSHSSKVTEEQAEAVRYRYRKGGNKSSGRYKERAVRGREERGGEDN